MNEWKVSYIKDGVPAIIVMADTIDKALEIFRRENSDIPGIAIYEIICVK